MPTRTRILPIPMGVGPTPGEYYTAAEIDAMLANYAKLVTTDLVNYYLKSETYTKAEVQQLVGQITSFEVVATLPVSDIKTNVIYLLGPIGTGADRYEEYIYSNNDWKKIGETSIDLSNYVTITQLNTALSFYTTTQQLDTLLAGKQDTLTAGDRITISSNTISADSQIVSLTQQEYDALGTNVDPDVVYVITDASPVVLATVATTGSYNDLTDKPTIPTVPTNVSAFTNDAGYITAADVPAQVKSDWNATTGPAQILNKPVIPTATNQLTNNSGYITAADVPAQVNSDWNASSGVAEILNKPTLANVATTGAYSDLTGTPTLATVATTGNYSDLNGTPTLATVATTGDYMDLSNAPTLATVATSGSYNDLTDKPTIGTVNDATITIQQDGVTVGTFTTNEANDKTIALTGGGGSVPQSITAFSNTAGYVTRTDMEAYINEKKVMDIVNSHNVYLTQAEYDQLGTNVDPDTNYHIEGDEQTLTLTFTLDGIGTVVYDVYAVPAQ